MLRSVLVASYLLAMSSVGLAQMGARPTFTTNAPQMNVGQQPVQFGLGMGGLGGGGMQVLPQNWQQQSVGQLTQPVLTPQQAMQLIPTDMLQQALNQRVAAFAQMGPGAGGVGVQQFAGVQQQQMPIQQQVPMMGGAGIGGIQQIPYGAGAGIPQQQQFPIQQQIPYGMQQQQAPIGMQQQQPMQFGGAGIPAGPPGPM